MRFSNSVPFRRIAILAAFVLGMVMAALVLLMWAFWSTPKSSKTGAKPPLFVSTYPADPRLKTELLELQKTGKLDPNNEQLITSAVETSARTLKMPPAILWCLLFQESRLDHLLGIDGERPIYGLGQFSHFSFFEINHQLTQYTDRNLDAMKAVLGKDVRPIGPLSRPLTSSSSYYNIPTAVVSTATFLNNRFLQLQRVLRWEGLDPDPELLWLYSTMAYNKGSRSVLNLWNEAAREQGIDAVRSSLSNRQDFLQLTDNRQLFQRTLSKIFPKNKARWYSRELELHIHQIRECALDPALTHSRELTNE